MARLNVNPTRMELKKLKARLNTAVRGHKLLKDKSDEMIRRFTVMARENLALRREVEGELGRILGQFQVARSVTPAYRAEAAFAMPSGTVRAECSTASVMGLDVPRIALSGSASSVLPYAYFEITSEADYSVSMVAALLPKLLRLAEVEKSVRMLDPAARRDHRLHPRKAERERARRPRAHHESQGQTTGNVTRPCIPADGIFHLSPLLA